MKNCLAKRFSMNGLGLLYRKRMGGSHNSTQKACNQKQARPLVGALFNRSIQSW